MIHRTWGSRCSSSIPSIHQWSNASERSPVDPLAGVDGNPHRFAFPQRVGSEEARKSRLRATLKVTACAETRERRRAPWHDPVRPLLARRS